MALFLEQLEATSQTRLCAATYAQPPQLEAGIFG